MGEFEELLFYVVELKDKLNAKLDEQCAKINQQAAIVLQQGQIIDELCWQLRELSEKTRELRTENQTLRSRVDRLEGDAGTYQNHVAERYNELTKVHQGHTAERHKVTVEYAQVDKTATSKKWPLRGQKSPDTPEDPAVNSGNTTWYLDLVESIYEPIQLSAKPTTAARLEQISAQVSSSAAAAELPKPAPRRRLYPTRAMENLAAYFGEVGSRSTITVEKDSPAEEVLLRSQDERTFGEKEQSLDSKVVDCSRFENLDKICLPEEQYLTEDNMVRFTVNSRPATTAPIATDKSTVDQRRHAIRSYI